MLRHRIIKKRLRKIRQDHEKRQAMKQGEKRCILTLARKMARWAILEVRSAGGREYWYPNRYARLYDGYAA